MEWIANILKAMTFCTVVNRGAQGVRLRFGKVTAVLDTGLHWCVFGVHHVYHVSILDDIKKFKQSLPTRDGKSIGIGVSIKYRVVDPVAWLFNVEDADSNITDFVSGITRCSFMERTWDEVITEIDEIEEELTTCVRGQMEEWGLHVVSVKLTDITPHRVYRMFGSSPWGGDEDDEE